MKTILFLVLMSFSTVLCGDSLAEGETGTPKSSGSTGYAISGTVKNTQGQLLKAAMVFVGEVADREGANDAIEELLPRNPDDMKHAMTAGNGRFQIKGIRAGTYVLWISHPDAARLVQKTVVGPGLTLPDEYVLSAGLDISGKVVDADGAPVKAVQVNANGAGSKETQTDSQGLFRISGLETGMYDVVVLEKEGEPAAASVNGVSAGSVDLQIALQRRSSVDVNVTLPDGKPAAGAAIRWMGSAVGSWFFSRGTDGSDDAARTDVDGSCTLDLKKGATYKITASLKGYPPCSSRVDLRAPESTNAVRAVRLTLPRGCAIKGRVLSAFDKKPVFNVFVRVPGDDPFHGMGNMVADVATSVTSADGSFQLVNVPAGIVNLVVSNTEAERRSAPLGAKKILVTVGGTNEVVIALAAPGSLRGTVLGAGKKPLRNARISMDALPDFSDWAFVMGGSPAVNLSARTDEAGRFEIKGIAPGRYVVSSFGNSATPAGAVSQRIVRIEGGVCAEIRMGEPTGSEGTFTISGKVEKGGKPFGKAIRMMAIPDNGVCDADTMMGISIGGSERRIDETGSYAFTGMTPGSYVYWISTNAEQGIGPWGREPFFNGVIDVQKGKTDYNISISSIVLSGRVTGMEGAPGQSLTRVFIVPSGSETPRKRMLNRFAYEGRDPSGKYSIDGLTEGIFDLYVWCHGGGPELDAEKYEKKVSIGPASSRHDIRLSVGVRLKGTVMAQNANQSAGDAVVLLDPSDLEPCGFTRVSPDGSFIMQALPVGEYLAMACKGDYAIETRKIQLKESAGFSATLVPGGDLRITVRGGPGKTVAGKRITLKTSGGESVVRCRSNYLGPLPLPPAVVLNPLNKDGVSDVKGLKPGSYLVGIEGSSKTVTAEVKALESRTAEIAL